MACACGSSCLGLPVSLVDYQGDGCLQRLHHMHMHQYEYESLKDVDRDRPEQKLCFVCVDVFIGGCGPDSWEAGHGEDIRVENVTEVKELGERIWSENGGKCNQVGNLFVLVSPYLSLDFSSISPLSTLFTQNFLHFLETTHWNISSRIILAGSGSFTSWMFLFHHLFQIWGQRDSRSGYCHLLSMLSLLSIFGRWFQWSFRTPHGNGAWGKVLDVKPRRKEK